MENIPYLYEIIKFIKQMFNVSRIANKSVPFSTCSLQPKHCAPLTAPIPLPSPPTCLKKRPKNTPNLWCTTNPEEKSIGNARIGSKQFELADWNFWFGPFFYILFRQFRFGAYTYTKAHKCSKSMMVLMMHVWPMMHCSLARSILCNSLRRICKRNIVFQ